MKEQSFKDANVNITHKLQNDENELTIRTAKGLDAKDPISLLINGNITAIKDFLEKRKDEIDPKQSHILVQREKQKMYLTINEIDPYFIGHVNASLTLVDDLKGWHINGKEAWESEDLANHIKMNRHCFGGREIAMKLHSDMKNFKAKVNKDIEKKSDDRANYSELRQQAVETNLPDKFVLEMPVFKGEDKISFSVEINIHPQTLDCLLISPELKEYMELQTNEIIDREIEKIKELSPDLVVIEG